MSYFFLCKWKNKNANIEIIINDDNMFTTVEIAGTMYPLNVKLLNNSFSPLILGKDFFSNYKWSHSEGENIKTPKCDLIVKCDKYGGYIIDNELSGQVFQSEEIKQKGGTTKKKSPSSINILVMPAPSSYGEY